MKTFFLFYALFFPLYLYGEAAPTPTGTIPPPTPAAQQRAPAAGGNANPAPLNVGSGAGGSFSLMDDYSKTSGTTTYDKDTPVEALEAQKEKIRKQEEEQQLQQKGSSSPSLAPRNQEPVENDSLPTAQYWQSRKQARYQERKQERLQRKEEERTLQVPSF